MGSSTSKSRNSNMSALLNYGYNMYSMQLEFKKGDIVTKKKSNKLDDEIIEIVAKEDAGVLVQKGEENKAINYEIDLDKFKLPIKKGQKIGTLKLKENNKVVSTIDLTVNKDIKKANLFKIYKRTLKQFIECSL